MKTCRGCKRMCCAYVNTGFRIPTRTTCGICEDADSGVDEFNKFDGFYKINDSRFYVTRVLDRPLVEFYYDSYLIRF
jgi:hypothetical protein